MKSQEFIDKIEDKLKSMDPAKRKTFLIFQFQFNNNDGTLLKSVVFDLKNNKVYEGIVESPDATITITDDDFVLWTTKKIAYDDLIAKVKITGNTEAVSKMLLRFHEEQ